ncbi:hypothetical protein [Solemya velum gill symbiont]|uniref:hypothetical protein n=1 Tax=Solemya velum gill symbiont TaxID=2340 RepID=UPI0009983964|nr:hypothetical protein [Solemya velum gill symbiont]OOZ72972.1 hypothetical protein BOW48_02335 [Solemya velum gill symbiont]
MNRQILHSIILISTVLLSFRVIADAPLDDELSQAMQLSPDVAKVKSCSKKTVLSVMVMMGGAPLTEGFPRLLDNTTV